MRSPSAVWFELRRRNVVRAAVLYIGSVWALAQGLAQLGPAFGLPDSATRWFVIACSIGFPFWLVLAWLYELTPEGLKRESEIAPEESIAHLTKRKLDYAIIAVLSIAVVLLATNTLVWRNGPGLQKDAKEIAAAFVKIPSQSVAVLPLEDASGDRNQQYFSDGLTEELISDLTQVDGLKVIGRYSSFKFRDSKDSPAQIGAALGVAHLIEGSVRRDGDHLRIVIGLIRAVDGANVWSRTYDRKMQDLFSIQSEIGHAVATALQSKLLEKPGDSGDRPASGDIEAYRLMLQGRAVARRGTEADYRRGIALLQQAVDRDPGYAYAWGALATYKINLANDSLEGDARKKMWAEARAAADRQLALAPDSAEAFVTRGYVLSQLDSDQAGALVAFQRAVSLAPHDGTIMNFLAYQLAISGQLESAERWTRKALATDPVRADWYSMLAGYLSAMGKLDAAEQAYRKVLLLQPDYPGVYASLAVIAIRRGDAGAALANAEAEPYPDARTLAVAMARQVAGDPAQADAALNDYVSEFGDSQPYDVASLYALRKQPDQAFAWLERAWQQHDPDVLNVMSDSFLLDYRNDPRFAAFVHKIGLPVPAATPAAAAVLPSEGPRP